MDRSIAARGLLVVVFLLVALAGIAHGQAREDPDLVPLEDETFAIASLVPADWATLEPGVHARLASPDDRTLIVLRSVPFGPDELWQTLLPQFGLAGPPDPTGPRKTPTLSWTLYRFDGSALIGDLTFDAALAEAAGLTYVILLQSAPSERAALVEAVFLPAIDAFEPIEESAVPAPGAEVADVSIAPGSTAEVAFVGGDPDVVLAGALSVPAAGGPYPAIVLFSGIGPQDRDSSYAPVARIEPFALIADALTQAGVAVLRYDDRGVGKSTGDHRSATISDFSADGHAALAYLAGRDDIDDHRIGLLGHGEGAIYAAAIAADDPRAAFVVGMAPPAVSGVELLVDQNVDAARALDDTTAGIERVRDLSRRLYAAVLDGDVSRVDALSREFYGGLWDDAGPEAQVSLGARESFISSQVARQIPVFFSDWYRSFLRADPAADWAQVQVPILAIFGGKDTQVPAARNELALRAAVAGGQGEAELTTIIVPEANHLFQAAETGLVAEYRDLGDEFAPDFLPALVDWVVATVAELEDAP